MNDDSFSDTNLSYKSKPGGMTQTIRLKLNFTDERQWKKFSARRLELIDSLSLSDRKASEQDTDITDVANRLRIEYGYPADALLDFEKLVRAGIQSVRRNRKRIPKFKTYNNSPTSGFITHHHSNHQKRGDATHYKIDETSRSVSPKFASTSNVSVGVSTRDNDTDMLDVEEDHRGRIAISALVSPDSSSNINNNGNKDTRKTTNINNTTNITNNNIKPEIPISQRYSSDSPASSRIYLPPLKNFDPIPEKMRYSIDQLVSLIDRSEIPAHQDVAKLEYTGFSILHVAATVSVQTHTFGNNDDYIRFINSVLLSNTVLQAVSTVLPASLVFVSEQQLVENLKMKVALAAVGFGFNTVISALSTLFEDIVNFDQLPDGQHYDFCLNTTLKSSNKNTNPSQNGLHMPSPGSSTTPSITPVTLRFLTQKLDFTYAPGSSTPPTIIEILENGKSAFHILGDNKVLKIRNLNANGAVIETDSDLAEVFETSNIDLELFFPVFDNVSSTSTTSSMKNIGFGINTNKNIIDKNTASGKLKGMRFQEVL